MFKLEYASVEAFSNTDPSTNNIDLDLRTGIWNKLMKYFTYLHSATRCNHLERMLVRLQEKEDQLS